MMIRNIRSFINYFTLAASISVTANAFASNLTADEQKAVEGLEAKGITAFYLLNEKEARLKQIKDGEVTLSVPVISGRNVGDTIETNPETTPAGIFEMRAFLNGEDIQYFRVGTNAYLIHEAGPIRQKLLKRWGTIPSKEFRVSSGCLNIAPEDFRRIYNQVALSEITSFLFVMPEREMTLPQALNTFHLENN
ncbi:MAG TPA: L,D-transpeptidase [Alphaproteobacteria bacterium]|nr:L,D-transpeptidase [Alphaproteobacteria bacterium]